MTRATVVGAGIVGLTTGLASRRAGIEVVICERAPGIRAAGASLGLWANAPAVFDDLGVGERVRRIGAPTGMYFHDPAGRLIDKPNERRGRNQLMTTIDAIPEAPQPRRARPRRISHAAVRARIGEPEDMIKRKVHDRLDRHARRFIAHSPFLAMATSDATGLPDSSPRGDYPGFVKVLDERTLAVPDRPGNQLADSFRNLAENDGIGLMFVIPGMREVLRVNGRAYPTDEPDVLARMRIEGKDAELAIVVELTEVFFHCGRALIRSRLWNPASQALAAEMPSIGQIAADQFGLDADPQALTDMLEDDYRHLY